MRRYYRLHAAIYDATRWTFLHGRHELVRRLELSPLSDATLLEVGCGTGHNLARLARYYPAMSLRGVDVSPHMLAHAAQATACYGARVQLRETAYAAGIFLEKAPDVVFFSYALTMFNPGWEAALDQALDDLPAGGRVAVVDFHDTRSGVFRRWMHHNHVRLDGHLLPALQARFRTDFLGIRTGGLGFWQYFLFVGQKI